MRADRIRSRDVGLRHVLENGLKLVRGNELSDERRQQVLGSLLQIFSEADRGSEALRSQNLTVALGEQRALERFSSFYRYLRHAFGNEVPNRLGEARNAIQELQEGSANELQLERLEQVINTLLESLRREKALMPLRAQRDFVYK